MSKILILGNGISRLSFTDLIRSWTGEVWGCNRAYKEYGDILARLTGHKEVIAEVAAERRLHSDWTFEIWEGHLGSSAKGYHRFTCPKKFQNDSGTTLVAQALHEGREIAVCGFDLGGWDIHSLDIEKVAKFNWVDRWRLIFEEYGVDRIEFIGHDHKPFILSDQSNDTYCHSYMHGIPHITDPDYIAAWEQHTGKKISEIQEGIMEQVRVRFKKNGYETVMNPAVAGTYKAKGKVEIIGKVKEEKPEPEAKKSTKSAKAEKDET